MPTQHTAVATAARNRVLQETLPASRNHIVNHQKPVSTTRPMTPSSTGPPTPSSPGPAGQGCAAHQHGQPDQLIIVWLLQRGRDVILERGRHMGSGGT
jgi:hypothetical protein